MSTRPAFEYYQEYYRMYAILYATEEGLFKEVPDDLASSSIGVEVVYRLCMGTPGGEVRIQDFYNKPAMDKDREEGGPITIEGREWYIEPGPSTVELPLIKRVSTFYDEAGLNRLKQMHDIAVSMEGILP